MIVLVGNILSNTTIVFLFKVLRLELFKTQSFMSGLTIKIPIAITIGTSSIGRSSPIHNLTAPYNMR